MCYQALAPLQAAMIVGQVSNLRAAFQAALPKSRHQNRERSDRNVQFGRADSL